jgi:CelD/BcsL family acetyltransferase involved in cellulose biosynthesis
VLGSLDPGELSTLRDAIVGSLRAERAHVARFRMLERGSSLHEAASTAPFLRRQHLSRPTVHWRTNVDRTADEFFAQLSKERRRAVRRYSRRLEERHGGELEIRAFHAPGDLERVLEDSGRVHRASYQHGLGVGFSEGELHRRLLELSLERGRFRGYVLYLAGEPVAFWHGESYGGVFATSATGFDARRAEDRPGTYLLMRLVRDLCADPSVQILDFGFGDADYKRSFGDVCREEEDVLVFAPGVRAVTANLARTAFEATSRAAHAALARGDALARVRRRWRGRLAPRTVLP